MTVRHLSALALLLTACAGGGEPVLSANAYGPVHFGARLEDAEKAAGGRADARRALNPDCDYVRFKALPKGQFMVEKGIVTRVDVEAGVPNALGIAAGTALSELRARQPKARILPHKYDPNGHSITISSTDAASAIVIEESSGRVTQIRAGLEPSVEYVERCS